MKSLKTKIYVSVPEAIRDPLTGQITFKIASKDDAGNVVGIWTKRGEEPKLVKSKLEAVGAYLPTEERNIWWPQIQGLTDLKPAKMYRKGKLGWNGLTFLTTSKKYGEGNFRLPEGLKLNRRLVHYQKGTLEGAVDLARFVLKSDAATVGLCAGYAVVTLRFLGLKPFVIYLYGPSKIGKSGIQVLAACIAGIYDDALMFNLNNTIAGLMEQASLFSARVFPIDEVKGKSTEARVIFDAVSQIAMTVSSGSTKVTHSSFNNGVSGEELDLIVMMSGRKSLSAYGVECGMNLDDGEAARVLQIRVHRSLKHPSLVDRYPENWSQEERDKFTKSYPVELRKRIAENHGKTLGVFIKHFQDNHDQKVLKLKEYWTEFLEHEDTAKGDAAFDHAVKSYASLYAAGRMAIDAELIPTTPEKLLLSLQNCLNRMDNPAERARKELEQALKAVRKALREAPRADEIESGSVDDNPFFFRKNGAVVCHKVSLCELVGGIHAGDLLAEYLSDRGLVLGRVHGGGSALLRMTNSERWPCEGKGQAVVFKDPWPEDRKGGSGST